MNFVLFCTIIVCSIFVKEISPLPIEDEFRHLDRPKVSKTTLRSGNNVQLFSKNGLANLIQFLNAVEGVILEQGLSSVKSTFNKYGVDLDKITPYKDENTGIPLFTCPICRAILGILEVYIKQNKPVEEIEATCVNLCITLKVNNEIVCRGAIGAFVHEVLYIVKMANIGSKDMCGFIVGEPKCEPKGFESKYNWTVKPHPNPKPPVTPLKPPQNGKPTKRVLHLSDTHLDPYYEEGAASVCNLPLCCRSSVGDPINPSDVAGKWGVRKHCDIPLRTLDDMMKHLASQKFDYIIWTGDLPPHDVYNQTKTGNLNHNHYVYNLFSTYFPNTPIFPALGNHETDPINSFPQPDVTDPDRSIAWLYKELSKSWPKLMLQESGFSADTLLKGGYYSVLLEPGFRIISLNMNYGNNLNFWLMRHSNDPADELAWLTEELGKAEAKGEKVHLLGHIPPGNDDTLRIWSRNFRQIVNRFENTITAQFYGHSHYDELIVFHDDDLKRATNIAYIGPSTTTFSFLNPAYHVYIVDGDYSGSTRMVLDGEGYYMDIEKANLNDKPVWEKLFSFKEAYGMESLTPQDWSEFVRKLPTDDALFKKFYKHFHRDSDVFPVCEDETCIQQLICKQMTAVPYDHAVCQDMGIMPSTSLFKSPGVLDYNRL